jgi:RNase P/RNase MRP subunit p29
VNVVGRRLTVLSSRDPTKTGLSGTAVLETANTIVLRRGSRDLRVEKSGCAFQLADTGEVLTDADLSGRLEDRWGKKD